MLDLTKYKHIHCIGIGGVGLSAIAEVLLSKGHTLSGSDMKENEHTERLKTKGATIY
ncbi:MAG: Mur ligase domain-containing protein, partial [Eubacteriales bacterium]|nr:Mur ligase domain-containing protein [Eubacteriales bacterium]